MPMMLGAGFALPSDSCNRGAADAPDARCRVCPTLSQTAATVAQLMLIMLGAGFALPSDSCS